MIVNVKILSLDSFSKTRQRPFKTFPPWCRSLCLHFWWAKKKKQQLSDAALMRMSSFLCAPGPRDCSPLESLRGPPFDLIKRLIELCLCTRKLPKLPASSDEGRGFFPVPLPSTPSPVTPPLGAPRLGSWITMGQTPPGWPSSIQVEDVETPAVKQKTHWNRDLQPSTCVWFAGVDHLLTEESVSTQRKEAGRGC